jgi:ATP-binding cassette subfamily G (WHITE) protein 2 (SNQ2)
LNTVEHSSLGYTIPKPSMIGALRWITYINPLRFGFESVLTNEFRTLNGLCSNLIPSGSGYQTVSIANQVCSIAGSLPGEAYVNGSRFVQLSYGFSWSHTWMNFGILMAFCIAFILALLVLTEVNISSSYKPPIVLFKRRRKANPIILPSSSLVGDAEKSLGVTDISSNSPEKVTPTAKAVEPMSHVFSWRDINYVVAVKGEKRKLLDNVSGFVSPGKLTALMGESGAGKTTLLNVLANRTFNGIITGTRLIDGRGLPRDFQSQTGYVQQMDTHTPLQTVREALLFSARMRQPISVSDQEKQELSVFVLFASCLS